VGALVGHLHRLIVGLNRWSGATGPEVSSLVMAMSVSQVSLRAERSNPEPASPSIPRLLRRCAPVRQDPLGLLQITR